MIAVSGNSTANSGVVGRKDIDVEGDLLHTQKVVAVWLTAIQDGQLLRAFTRSTSKPHPASRLTGSLVSSSVWLVLLVF